MKAFPIFLVPGIGNMPSHCASTHARASCAGEMFIDPAIFATDHALAKVRAGVPFRDAYRQAKEEAGGALSPEEAAALCSSD